MPRRAQERTNARPRRPIGRHGRQALRGDGRQRFAEQQSPHDRQIHPTIESMTGRRASSIWAGSRLEPGLRMVRTSKRPSPNGAVVVAQDRDMGREVNLEAGSRTGE